MLRPLAGACSSLITTILLYPLDVRKAYAHVNMVKPISYRGVAWDACGSFAATYAYFDTYERLLPLYGVPPAAAAAVSVSSLIASPIGTIVRRLQLEESQTLTLRAHLNVYMLTVSRNMPKAIVKYTVYEWVYLLLGANVANVVCGLVGGVCASIVSTILFAPMDYWKTCLTVRKHPRWREVFQGCTSALVYSAMSNGLGHAILEFLSPRIPPHLS